LASRRTQVFSLPAPITSRRSIRCLSRQRTAKASSRLPVKSVSGKRCCAGNSCRHSTTVL